MEEKDGPNVHNVMWIRNSVREAQKLGRDHTGTVLLPSEHKLA